MGYTHYWEFQKPEGIRISELEERYNQAVVECQKIAVAWNNYWKEAGSYNRLSGYAAHCKPGTYGGIKLNGKQELSHEDFELPEHFSDNFKHPKPRGFCKTARKPYDTVVTACLAVLKYRLGDAVVVSSDGQASDWAEGVLWARGVLRRAVPNPLKLDTTLKLACQESFTELT